MRSELDRINNQLRIINQLVKTASALGDQPRLDYLLHQKRELELLLAGIVESEWK